MKLGQRFGMSPLAVAEESDELIRLVEIVDYAYRKEAS